MIYPELLPEDKVWFTRSAGYYWVRVLEKGYEEVAQWSVIDRVWTFCGNERDYPMSIEGGMDIIAPVPFPERE